MWLSQMIAMRYGTLPIVHQIGGLQDSVQPYNPFDHSGPVLDSANTLHFI
uniref:CAZy families GT5 protein n=1 Tax=uncultured Lactobacillus sp. TaxID=153152 RepID=A0A060CDZ5_9LACO|nr:CAZy families GT5 protein [uncultured Lactobacillus sp.]